MTEAEKRIREPWNGLYQELIGLVRRRSRKSLTWSPLRFWRRLAWLIQNWNLRAAAALASDRLTGFALRKITPLRSAIQGPRNVLRIQQLRRAFVRRKVEEELFYVASKANFKGEASK